MKKANISLFMIVGLIIILMFIILYYGYSVKSQVSTPDGLDQDIDSTSLELYSKLCFENSVDNGIKNIGINDTESLKEYVEYYMWKCIKENDYFQGEILPYEIKLFNFERDTDNSSYLINMNYPILFKLDNRELMISDYYYKKNLISSISLPNNNGTILDNLTIISSDKSASIQIEAGTNATFYNGTPINEISLRIIDLTGINNESPYFIGYDMQPSGAIFDPPLLMKIKYDPNLMQSGSIEKNFTIGYLMNNTWLSYPSWVDIENKLVYANISHFTVAAIMTPWWGVRSVRDVLIVRYDESQLTRDIVVNNESIKINVTENHVKLKYYNGARWRDMSPNQNLNKWNNQISIDITSLGIDKIEDIMVIVDSLEMEVEIPPTNLTNQTTPKIKPPTLTVSSPTLTVATPTPTLTVATQTLTAKNEVTVTIEEFQLDIIQTSIQLGYEEYDFPWEVDHSKLLVAAYNTPEDFTRLNSWSNPSLREVTGTLTGMDLSTVNDFGIRVNAEELARLRLIYGEWVYENGQYCGRYGLDPSLIREGRDIGPEFISTGYHEYFQGIANSNAKCFVQKYVHENGPANYTFPLPRPTIDISCYACDGEPECFTYTWQTEDITISIYFLAKGDCIACDNYVHIDGPYGRRDYSYRQDPDCGRDVEGSNYASDFAIPDIGDVTCGAYGVTYMGFDEDELECQESSCRNEYYDMGKSNDCNHCCVKASCDAILYTINNYTSGRCDQNGNCDSNQTNLGASYDCVACCADIPPNTVNISNMTCGSYGATYMGFDEDELECQESSCSNQYYDLGKSNDCNHCCVKTSCGAILEVINNYESGRCDPNGNCHANETNLGESNDCVACCADTNNTIGLPGVDESEVDIDESEINEDESP